MWYSARLQVLQRKRSYEGWTARRRRACFDGVPGTGEWGLQQCAEGVTKGEMEDEEGDEKDQTEKKAVRNDEGW